jgi:Protein of unknown function (DUF3309)
VARLDQRRKRRRPAEFAEPLKNCSVPHAGGAMGFLVLISFAADGGNLSWPYSRDWGYDPSGCLGLVLACVITFALDARFRSVTCRL